MMSKKTKKDTWARFALSLILLIVFCMVLNEDAFASCSAYPDCYASLGSVKYYGKDNLAGLVKYCDLNNPVDIRFVCSGTSWYSCDYDEVWGFAEPLADKEKKGRWQCIMNEEHGWGTLFLYKDLPETCNEMLGAWNTGDVCADCIKYAHRTPNDLEFFSDFFLTGQDAGGTGQNQWDSYCLVQDCSNDFACNGFTKFEGACVHDGGESGKNYVYCYDFKTKSEGDDIACTKDEISGECNDYGICIEEEECRKEGKSCDEVNGPHCCPGDGERLMCIEGVCSYPCSPTCDTGPGCMESLDHGYIVSGDCCGNGQCYKCDEAGGYHWDGNSCTVDCAESCEELGKECGSWPDGCGNTIDCEECSEGNCVDGICCLADCDSLGYECGTHTICGLSVPCGEDCGSGYSCAGGKCVKDCTDTCISLGYECGYNLVCDEPKGCGNCGDDEVCIHGKCNARRIPGDGWIETQPGDTCDYFTFLTKLNVTKKYDIHHLRWAMQNNCPNETTITINKSLGSSFSANSLDEFNSKTNFTISLVRNPGYESLINKVSYNSETGQLTISFSDSESICSQAKAAFDEYNKSHFCCGDDYEENNAEQNDCGYMGKAEALCWPSGEFAETGYRKLAYGVSSNVPYTTLSDPSLGQGGEQWYWTRPGDAENLMVDIECDGKQSKDVNPLYKDDAVSVISDGAHWIQCDHYAYSVGEPGLVWPALNVSNSTHFNLNKSNPYDAGGNASFLCSHSYYDGDKISYLDGVTYVNNEDTKNVLPKIFECDSDEQLTDREGALNGKYFGGRHVDENEGRPSNTTMPYFGGYSRGVFGAYDNELIWGHLKLSELLRPDIEEGIFPYLSSADSIAYVPAGEMDKHPKLKSLCASYHCLIFTKGSSFYIMNSQGELGEMAVSDIISGEGEIKSLTYAKDLGNSGKDALIGTTGPGKAFSVYNKGSGDCDIYSSFDDMIDCADLSSVTASSVEYLSYIGPGYFDSLFPKLVIQQSGKLTEVEFNYDGDECSVYESSSTPLAWDKTYNNGQNEGFSGEVEAFEAIYHSEGLSEFYLPKKTPVIILSEGDDIFYLIAAPLSCYKDEWIRDYDKPQDDYIKSLCEEQKSTFSTDNYYVGGYDIGGKYIDNLCCGEPQDIFESYFSASGLCYRGIWNEPVAGYEEIESDLVSSFFDDPLLNQRRSGSSKAGELKELILWKNSSEAYLRSCAVNSSAADARYPELSEMIQDIKPYQGSSNLLMNWEFGSGDNGIEPWIISGGERKVESGLISVEATSDFTVKHYIPTYMPGKTYNFRLKYMADKDDSLGKTFSLFFEEDGSKKKEASYNITNAGKWIEAALIFDTKGTIPDEKDYVGLDVPRGNFTFKMKSPKLSSNDYLLEHKVGDGNSHYNAPTGKLIESSQDAGYCEMIDINKDYDQDYYCSFREIWNEVPSEWENLLSGELELKHIQKDKWWDIRGTELVDNNVQVAGCCRADQCWNGTSCVDSDNKIARPKLYPNSSSREGYRCWSGEWLWVKPKWDWNNEDKFYGYCPNESMCLVDPFGSPDSIGSENNYSMFAKYDNYEVYSDNPVCIDSGDYILDHYCEQGNWTSRTSKLISGMLEYVSHSQEYTLFCDNFSNTLNYFDFNVTHGVSSVSVGDGCSRPHEVEGLAENKAHNAYILNNFDQLDDDCLTGCYYHDSNLSGDSRFNDRRYPCANSICVLSYKDGSRMKNIIGASLNQGINATNYPFMDLIPDAYYDIREFREKKMVIFASLAEGGLPSQGTSYDGVLLKIISIIKDNFWDPLIGGVLWQDSGLEAPHEVDVFSGISRFYMANYDTGSSVLWKVMGATVYSYPRNLLSDKPKKAGVVSSKPYSDTYLEYYPISGNYRICDTVTGQKIPAWDDERDICRNYTRDSSEYTVVLSHEESSEEFYDGLWPYYTARLRPGR